MKAETKITHHAGKGSQQFLPSKGAVRRIVQDPQAALNKYAKAGPNVVRNGPSIVGKEP